MPDIFKNKYKKGYSFIELILCMYILGLFFIFAKQFVFKPDKFVIDNQKKIIQSLALDDFIRIFSEDLKDGIYTQKLKILINSFDSNCLESKNKTFVQILNYDNTIKTEYEFTLNNLNKSIKTYAIVRKNYKNGKKMADFYSVNIIKFDLKFYKFDLNEKLEIKLNELDFENLPFYCEIKFLFNNQNDNTLENFVYAIFVPSLIK